MELGVMVHLMDDNIDSRFKQVKDHGFKWCQLCCWQHELFTEEIAKKIDEARVKYLQNLEQNRSGSFSSNMPYRQSLQ